MFKLVVLSALLAAVAAKPSFLHSAHVAALQSTVSHSSRTEVHPSPVVAAVHAVPAVAAVHTVPAVASVHAIPAAVSHSSRFDVHSSAYVAAPIVASIHAAPVVTAVHAAPVLRHHGHHAAYSIHPY